MDAAFQRKPSNGTDVSKLDLKNASVQQRPFHPVTALSLQRSSPFCHPERTRISCFTALTADPGCGSLQREPHAADRSRNSRQEIRGSRGICGAPLVCPAPTGLHQSSKESSWKHQPPPLCDSGFPGVVRRTADPSASLGMTKRKEQRFINSGC
jgi:hypothetical protein